MAEELYKPHPREFYGIMHVPIIVTPVESNRRSGQAVAFIGKQLCFFENEGPQPKIGVPIEVMITRPLHARLGPNDNGPAPVEVNGRWIYGFNWNKLTAVLIRPVEPENHILVAIDGFECSGTMCSTTARGVITDGSRAIPIKETYSSVRKDRVRGQTRVEETFKSLWLTPGRSRIREASNVNAGSTWKQPYQPLHPTNVYVERAIYEEKSGCGVRVAGLTRVEDCDYARLFRV